MKNLKITVAFILAVVMVSLCSCKFENADSLINVSTANPSVTQQPNNPYPGMTENTVSPSYPDQPYPNQNGGSFVPEIPTAGEQNTMPEPVNPAIPTNPVPSQNADYSSYTKRQIIDTYATALAKTRGYMGDLTVHHTETLNSDFKNVHSEPGGERVEKLVAKFGNYILNFLGEGDEQDLHFRNGKATNKDKEVVPILLPQRTSFSLPESGVKSAYIEKKGDNVHIVITLVPEKVSMGGVPKYNAGAIGYLDTSELDFKLAKIERVDINYLGSVIDATIRPDGYISYVKYTINMFTDADISGLGISGGGSIDGNQTEEWQLMW